jgi:hypothetical protein
MAEVLSEEWSLSRWSVVGWDVNPFAILIGIAAIFINV